MRNVFLGLIRTYQWVIRPLLPQACRFYPSCSCYAHEAITKYGAIKGTRLAIVRISRCHPWNSGGYDPVEPLQTDDLPAPRP